MRDHHPALLVLLPHAERAGAACGSPIALHVAGDHDVLTVQMRNALAQRHGRELVGMNLLQKSGAVHGAAGPAADKGRAEVEF